MSGRNVPSKRRWLQTKPLTIGVKPNTATYVFRWLKGEEVPLLRHLGILASNPASSFTWYMAAIVSTEVREYMKEK